MAVEQYLGTGRRKTSVARVYLRPGSGSYVINGRESDKYFSTQSHVYVVNQPLEAVDGLGKFDIVVNVKGGGKAGQAGAIRHGLARALAKFDESNHSVMRANGFLTRDSRMVERKKYGQPGARK
ncbi:MAG: 30S ribosomal protein S9, partial [Spirochaetota bacterium]